LRDLVPQAVRPDGSVNRDALKAAIAKNPEVLGQLEQRIHPLVAKDRAEFLATHARASIVVLDIPLLFETNGPTWSTGLPWLRQLQTINGGAFSTGREWMKTRSRACWHGKLRMPKNVRERISLYAPMILRRHARTWNTC
jgi:hypothetical protein